MDNNKQINQKLIDESFRKGEILKESLKIVDELGELDPDGYTDDEDIENLIKKAKNLKKNRLWKLR